MDMQLLLALRLLGPAQALPLALVITKRYVELVNKSFGGAIIGETDHVRHETCVSNGPLWSTAPTSKTSTVITHIREFDSNWIYVKVVLALVNPEVG